MKTKRTTRTTEIIVERDEVHAITRVGQRMVRWCAECGREVEMITAEEAMVFTGVSQRTISEWVDSGRLHLAETPIGLLMCVSSLGLRNTQRTEQKAL